MSAVLEINEPQPIAPTEIALLVRELSLTIDGRVVLNDVGLSVPRGEVVAVLGPKGAGKSSVLRCVLGLTRPDRGQVELDTKQAFTSQRIASRSSRERVQLGVVFEESTLETHSTALENLLVQAALYGVSRRDARERAGELLTFFELAEHISTRVCELNLGERRRLEIARALIQNPSVVLLDEPVAGLEREAALRIWSRLRALCEARELSVVVTTARARLAALCDRVVLLNRGHVVACDSPKNLLTRVAGDVVVVRTHDPHKVAEAISSQFNVRPRMGVHEVVVEVDGGHELVSPLFDSLEPGSFDGIEVRRPTLADVFFHLTARNLEP